MKKILFLHILFLFGCGHTQQTLLEDTVDTPNFSEGVGTPCQDFAQAVASFQPGAGAGYGQRALPDIVLGPPHGNGRTLGGLNVAALGQNGKIIVNTFPCEIVDGDGIDFIIFENAFFIGGVETNPFAELGVVSVSSDGENFISFPCRSEEYPYTGCAGWHPVFSNPENGIDPFDVEIAGGDPYDLAEIGVDRARYVQIEDVAGGGFPPSVGFDLDAVAVIHGMKGE